MLVNLSIRNIVLIEKLDLTWRAGLCTLTGETGAGKSILLDALALATGARGDAGLVRSGAEQGTFDIVTRIMEERFMRTNHLTSCSIHVLLSVSVNLLKTIGCS